MCTVTVVPFGEGVRIVCNRDEQRTRAEALPPIIRRTNGGVMICPIDPVGGGTWTGAADHGFAAALLNRNPPGGGLWLRTGALTRGRILLSLLASRSFDIAIRTAAALDCRSFNPFTIVIVHARRAAIFTSGGRRCSLANVTLDAPLLFTSSSLGDALVEPARRELFDRTVVAARDQLDGQFRFHRHQWTRARDISVLMERGAAATVSRTTIDLLQSRIRLYYEPVVAPATRCRQAA